MKTNYDVIVVGAGTAGSFFAKKMAEKKYSVLVIDKADEKSLGSRLEIFHIDKAYFDKYGVPMPKYGDEDYVSEFSESIARSAYNNYPISTNYPFIVMKLPLFLKRLKKWAENSGVEYSLKTEFHSLTFDNGKISGIIAKKNNKQIRINARLVVDCSGIASVVRKTLPNSLGIENFIIGDNDKFYVVLRYVTLKHPKKDRVTKPITYPIYKSWIAPQADPNGAIIGVGANLSFEYAEKCFQNFKKKIPLPEYELNKIEKGTTPYRRPPYSFVTDGFITLGDSACITKPFSGEGITAAWNLCDIAAEIANNAMKNKAYPTREKLWDINVNYTRSQGANFAYLLATLIGAADCTETENEYEFEKEIVFNSKYMTELNKNFAVIMSPCDVLSLGCKVIFGVIRGKIRFKTVKTLMRNISIATILKYHYKRFPKNPKKFEKWVKKSDKLWGKIGSMADIITDY